jgi:O-antigen/teichoic acid export membrane protein|tara:strand:- start:247 stop:468 length:222 start_codon:yes stop_codon:yes gene_type:complete
MLIRIILINLISLISILPNAYAYLDPGTGSFILQAIVGFLAAISAGFIYYWTKVKNFLTKFFKKNSDDKKSDI